MSDEVTQREARLRDRAFGRAGRLADRTVGALEVFVVLAVDQGTRLVDVLDRAVDLYERQVEVQEHMAFGTHIDDEDGAS